MLIQEYDARLPIYHFDAYRLPAPATFATSAYTSISRADGVCLVEWADRVASSLPPQFLQVSISITGEHSRRFVIEAHGERYESLVALFCDGA